MTSWRTGDVIANGVRLHYYRTGGDRQPIVLSHGFTDSGPCWNRLAADLAADHDIVMYDLRAHGRSEAPARGYSADDRAADLVGLVGALELTNPVLLGHSMGAETTAYAAAAAPALPRAVILEDPPFVEGFYGANSEALAAKAEELRRDIVARRAMSTEELLESGRAQHPAWTADDLIPWAEAKKLAHPNAAMRRRDVPARGWRDTLPMIGCPVLFITADVDRGALITSEVASEMLRLLARGSTSHVAGAGHNVRRDRYPAYLAAVRSFLAGA
jgi:N-formylmaleamate deformylase